MSGESAARPAALLASILLDRRAQVDAPAVVRQFTQLAPAAPRLVAEPSGSTVSAWSMVGSPMRVFAAPVAAPVPNGQAEAAARYSIPTYATGWRLPTHVMHLAVTADGADKMPRLDALGLFSRVVAALSRTQPAVGIYWNAGDVTIEPRAFIAAANAAKPAMTLWIGVEAAKLGFSHLSLTSRGMLKQFGLPELQLLVPANEPAGVLQFLADVQSEAARRGAPLPDGHPVGRRPSERLPVRYVKSADGADLMQVEVR